MRKSNWTPSIVPTGEDQNDYMLVDDWSAREDLARDGFREH
jgi:hypothetical protein